MDSLTCGSGTLVADNQAITCHSPACSEFSILRSAQTVGAGGEIPVLFLGRVYFEEEGQDVAEYAIMLGVVLVIVIGTVQLIGANSNNVFSSVASTISN
jgi:Flp pilus assembly pilin Flp